MHALLQRNLFLIKEKVGILKASNEYDIFDESNQQIMKCTEPQLGVFAKMFRFTEYKRLTPFNIEVRDTQGKKVLSVKRGTSLWLSKVQVFDENEQLVGIFKQKFFSIGGKFDVLDPNENVLCTLKGKWTGWDFKFERDGIEFAQVTKQWAGIGKEFFTSADNYALVISDKVNEGNALRILIFAAVMCIDMVLKE
jgi:uncharacterized protein YxjI